jgi:hypothetical protein
LKKKFKKILALLTVLALIIVMVAACGNDTAAPDTPPPPEPDPAPAPEPAEPDEPDEPDEPEATGLDFGGREFVILSWDQGYETFDPDPGLEDPEYEGQDWDNLQRIFEDFNGSVRYEIVAHEDIYEHFVRNMLAGNTPWDLVNIPRANLVSAIANDLIMSMENVVPADDPFWGNHGDWWTHPTSEVMGNHYGLGRADNLYPWSMSYNKNLINAAGLDDPGMLYDTGAWTWEVFLEQLRVLTTFDSAGVPNQWGLSGGPDKILRMMLASNDGAMVNTEDFSFGLDNPNSVRAFEFFTQVIVDEQLAKPFVDSWTDWGAYDEGDVGFWVNEQWFVWAFGNLFWDEEIAIGSIPFPRGPDNNRGYTHFSTGHEGIHIPAGATDPLAIYHMFFEMGMAYRYFSDEAFESETGEATVAQLRSAAMDYIYFLFGDDPRDAERIADAWQNNGKFEWGEWLEILTYDEVMTLASGEVTSAQFIEEMRPVVTDKIDEMFGELRR